MASIEGTNVTASWRGMLRCYAALGDTDKAVPAIKTLFTTRQGGYWPLTSTLLRLDPLFDKLRGDPRFEALANQAP
jgi:hypothetical protein